MRPVLIELGPWSPAAIPVLAALLGGLVCLWTWLDARQRGAAPPRPLEYLLSVLGAVLAALALFFLVNRFGPVPIRSYGFMLLLGMLAGLLWMSHSASRYGIPRSVLVDVALAALLGGIVGARLLYVILDWDQFAGTPGSVWRVWEGGLSFHGGLAGGLLAGYLLARWRGLSFLSLGDAAAPAIALAYAFARVGCFLNGCCFGGHCDSFWGVRFAPGSEAATWSLHLPPGQVATTWGEPLYPAQLLAAVLSLVIFLLLIRLQRVFTRGGHLLVAFVGLYGIERFVVEFWRHGASGRSFPGLSFLTWAQVASLALTLAAVVTIIATWPSRRTSVPPAPSSSPTRKGKHQ